MRPADLLGELETGDRTNEHLYPQPHQPQAPATATEAFLGSGVFDRRRVDELAEMVRRHMERAEYREAEEAERQRHQHEARIMGRGVGQQTFYVDDFGVTKKRRGWFA